MTSPRCPLPVYPSGYGDDRHILTSRVYLLKSSDLNGPRYWLFKQREKQNGDIVLHNLFPRSKSFEYGCLYPTFTLDLLRCQVFELAQEHVAYYTWYERFERAFEVEEHICLMRLGPDNNEFMVLQDLIFEDIVYRSIDGDWTEFQIREPGSFLVGIVSYKSKFYVIDHTGTTGVVDPTLQVKKFQRSRPCDKTRKSWLLNSGDKVLLVEICSKSPGDYCIPNIREKKIWFEVSELDEERNDWNLVEDMDGRVLFLGNFFSFSCLATEIQGFRANSIIFQNPWGGSEKVRILVYEFDEHGVRYLEDVPEYVELFPSPPGWVISNA